MKAVNLALGLIVASLACVSVSATEAQAGAQAGANPSYIMPAAFPTPYYSQFLPPYQNFNPFYPLPSVSYVGPQRNPFRQWSPYYYYGGPVQWGSGPASAVPTPTATVASVQSPSTASFLESSATMHDEVDMAAQVEALVSGSEIPTALVEMSAEAEAEAEDDWRTAALRHEGPVNPDPIGTRRAQAAARRFAESAQWAEKFEKVHSSFEKAQRQKRIAEMRGEAFLEIDASAEAEAEVNHAVELAAAAHAEIAANAELDSEAEALAEVEREIDATIAAADASGLEPHAIAAIEMKADEEADVDADAEETTEEEAEVAAAEEETAGESFMEVGAQATAEVSAEAQAQAQAQAAAMAQAESMVYAQIEAAVRGQKEIQSLLAVKEHLTAEAASLLDKQLNRIIADEVNAAFEEARAELVAEGKFPDQGSFSLLETQAQKSSPEAKQAFNEAFDKAYYAAIDLAKGDN